MSQKLNENFDSKIAVDPFYSASNMAHLRRGIDALDAGNGVEHEIIEDSNIVWIDNNETLVTNKYLAYCYSLKPWNVAEGGTIQRLYNDNLMKAIIAVPSIEEQNRITTITDGTIAHDGAMITVGLGNAHSMYS